MERYLGLSKSANVKYAGDEEDEDSDMETDSSSESPYSSGESEEIMELEEEEEDDEDERGEEEKEKGGREGEEEKENGGREEEENAKIMGGEGEACNDQNEAYSTDGSSSEDGSTAASQHSTTDTEDSDYMEEWEEKLPYENDDEESDSPKMIWLDEHQPPKEIRFTGSPGLKKIPDKDDPISFFDLLVEDRFYELVTALTNENAQNLIAKAPENSKMARWKPLTVAEFKKFLGLLYHTGTIQVHWVEDFWRNDSLFNFSIFKDTMRRSRFTQILSALTFENASGADPGDVALIQPLVDYFNDKMSEVYYPGKELMVDEPLVIFKGRVVPRQATKGKRHKYNVRIHSLVEQCGITLRLLVSTGSLHKDHAQSVVKTLMEGKLNSGHSLYTHKYYSCTTLARDLLSLGTYNSGELCANRRDSPSELAALKLKSKEMAAKYWEGVSVLKWKCGDYLMMLSTEFPPVMDQDFDYKGRPYLRPRTLFKCCEFMDPDKFMEQLESYYPCHSDVMEWHKKVAIHILQLLILNSFVLHKRYGSASNSRRSRFYDFRLQILNHLLHDPSSVKKQIKSSRKAIKERQRVNHEEMS